MSESKAMSGLLKFSGLLGVVLLVFGIIGALVVGSFTLHFLVFLHILLGLLFIVLWLFTTGFKAMESAGEVLSGRTARFSYNATLYTVVFLGFVVVANLFATWKNHRWDLTEQGVFSLSDMSQKAIESLKKPLKLVAIDSPGVGDGVKTKELLKLFKYINPKMVTTELIDPRVKPLEPDKLGMKQGNLLYLQYGEGDKAAISRINEVNEQSVTNAILKLTKGEAKKIYYIQGHGEPALDGKKETDTKFLADALVDEHFTTEPLLLLQKGTVPDDAAEVILAAPKKALQQAEMDALIKYADGGGRLLLLANPEDRESTDIRTLADHYGITVGNDIVIDQVLKILAGPELAVQFPIIQFGNHPIVSRLTPQEPPVFTFASSVTLKGKPGANETYTELLKSGPQSWGETDVASIFASESPEVSKDASDVTGPISLAVAYEKRIDTQKDLKAPESIDFNKMTRVVVVGDASWMENAGFNVYSNRDLMLNMVNWAIGEEGGVTIRPKSMRNSSLSQIKQETFTLILTISFVIPELILLIGLFVWWRRRAVSI